MTIHMSEDEARRAGLLKGRGPKRTTAKAAGRDGARSRCTCGAEFTTDAAETRHVGEGHNRFETVLEGR